MLQVQVRRLDPDVPLPAYAHPGDAGCDLVTTVDVVLAPGERAALPTGIALALPAGHVGLVHPRSGLARELGIGLVNAPGTVDSGFRGEVVVLVVNHDRERSVHLRRLDRIAQLVVQRVERVSWDEVRELPAAERGEAGFGSSGTSAAEAPAGQAPEPGPQAAAEGRGR